MEQLSLLVFLSISMLIGSFLSGLIPMAFKLSDSKSRLLALVGSGILVGTALAIIIPEGINSLVISAKSEPQDHPGLPSIPDHSQSSTALLDKAATNSDSNADEKIAYWTIGPSLVIGFILMLFIDQFSIYLANDRETNNNNNQYSHHHHPAPNRNDYTLTSQDDDEIDLCCDEETLPASNGLGASGDKSNDKDSETRPIKQTQADDQQKQQLQQQKSQHRVDMRSSGLKEDDDELSINSDINNYHSHSHSMNNNHIIRQIKPKVTPTLGLVIHAAADGIALGAAATTSHRQVELIIFLAIMLHKGPAAFSLVVFLIHMGLKHSTIRRHLLAFSLSAPIAALVTYFGLSQSSKEALRQTNATGVAMLFSAGTFLYVATVHVLPELIQNKLLSRIELLCLVAGSFLPIVLSSCL